MTIFLASLGFKSQVVDFHRPTSDDGRHPELFKWVLKYFQEREEKLPLLLQRKGHSQLIIGIEQNDSDLTLLLLDPTTRPQQIRDLDSLNNPLELLRYNLNALLAEQYQIVAVKGLFKDEEEKEVIFCICHKNIVLNGFLNDLSIFNKIFWNLNEIFFLFFFLFNRPAKILCLSEYQLSD